MSQSTPTVHNDRAQCETTLSTAKLSRSYVACRRCHGQKVKCSGETPCRNCKVSKRGVECVYPVRDKKVAVSEQYLRSLESQNRSLKRGASLTLQESTLHHDQHPTDTTHDGRSRKRTMTAAPIPNDNDNCNDHQDQDLPNDSSIPNTNLDETSIQPTYVGEAACTTFGTRLHQFLTTLSPSCSPKPQTIALRPKYYTHPHLTRPFPLPSCSLPNRSDAHLLVRVVLRFIGPDYHLIRKKSFLEKLDQTYQLDVLDDPIWLCRLFTVFALGEVYTVRSSRPKGEAGCVPGTGFFARALEYWMVLYEEPSIEYIETLVLLSFYSTTLNRRNTAYTYIGIALRLSIVLGLHRKLPATSTLPPSEREHRTRVWWTVYVLDRMMSSKVGLPAMIQDSDIDTPLPSLDGLSQDDREDFYDPAYLVAQITLAKITGCVLGSIYHIPGRERGEGGFVRGVQGILGRLRAFHEGLPGMLRLDVNASPMYLNRTVASMHLHLNQCVILTTRPILFYLFRQTFAQNKVPTNTEDSRVISQMTIALAETCVQTARKSNKILSQLWVDGCLAVYGFYDALSIFSTTLVLMIAAAMEDSGSGGVDEDAIGVAWSLLRSMRDDGNVTASDYYEQLLVLEADLKQACESRRQKIVSKSLVEKGEADGFQLLLAASGTETEDIDTTSNLGSGSQGGGGLTMASSQQDYLGSNELLNDPFLSGFLAQPQASWPFDVMFGGDGQPSWGSE